jgi:hypothetical protein
MMSKLFAMAIPLSLALVGGTARAQQSSAPPDHTSPAGDCILGHYRITSVRPYVHEVNNGKRVVSRELRGAELYVDAQPGVTREWLTSQLEQHVRTMASSPMTGCPLAVQGARVDVVSAGPGFRVRLTGPNEAQAEQILQLARSLGRTRG